MGFNAYICPHCHYAVAPVTLAGNSNVQRSDRPAPRDTQGRPAQGGSGGRGGIRIGAA